MTRKWRLSFATAIAGVFAACSPTMFSNDLHDGKVASTPSYRKINPACANMDLSQSSMDPETVVKLVKCFNSQGALPQTEAFVVKMFEKARLQTLITTANKYVLDNRQILFQLEKTYFDLEDKNLSGPIFEGVGKMLENDAFVAASLGLLKEGFEASMLKPGKPFFKAMEKLGSRVTHPNIESLVDTSYSIADAPAFEALQSHFRTTVPGRRDVGYLVDRVHRFLKYRSDHGQAQLGKSLLQAVSSGALLPVLDQWVGISENEMKSRLARGSSVFEAMSASTATTDAEILTGLTSLFTILKSPVVCLKGTQTVQDAPLFITSEMNRLRGRSDEETAALRSQFVRRDALLELTALNAFCDYPAGLGDHYPSLVKLAEGRAFEPATQLLELFYNNTFVDVDGRQRRLIELLFDMLSDIPPGGLRVTAEDPQGIQLLMPLFAEFKDRDAWKDFLLVVALPRLEDRKSIEEALRFVVEPIEALPGRASIYDILVDAFADTTTQRYLTWILSLKPFVDSEQAFLKPVLDVLRSAHYVNDAYPLTEVVGKFLREASQNEEFIRAAVEVSDWQEFRGVVKEVSNLAKNGQLKALTASLVTLFHKFAKPGQTEIHPQEAPPRPLKRRHDLVSTQLVGFAHSPQGPEVSNSCKQIDIHFPMDQYQRKGEYDRQMNQYLSCMNWDGADHLDLTEAIQFLRSKKTEEGQSYWGWNIDLLKNLKLETSQVGYLANQWLKVYGASERKFHRLLDAIPYWVTEPARGGPVLRPLVEVIGNLFEGARGTLYRMQILGARILRNHDSPKVLSHLLRIHDQSEAAKPPRFKKDFQNDLLMAPSFYSDDEIARAVIDSECEDHDTDASMKEKARHRVPQIRADMDAALTTWESIGGSYRSSWTLDELKKQLEPLFKKIGDPSQGNSERTILKGLAQVLHYFSLEPGQERNARQHYLPSHLKNWLVDRSDDYRLISYFYPGEHVRRARLVNSLDRLELVLHNASFVGPKILHKNFGMKFIGQIADSWGDLEPALWPQEIRAKFPNPAQKRPPKLAETIAEIRSMMAGMMNLVGYPYMAQCTDKMNYNLGLPDWFFKNPSVAEVQARLWNLDQVLSVLDENLPDKRDEKGDLLKTAGGLEVLRDLFFELKYSTPHSKDEKAREEAENPAYGQVNNLSIVADVVRLGLIHQAGRQLRLMGSDDPSLDDFFKGLVYAASSKEPPNESKSESTNGGFYLEGIADALLRWDSQHSLIWDIMGEVFKNLESPEATKHTRQLAYYFFAELGRIQPAIGGVMKQLPPVLQNYWSYLSKQSPKVGEILRDPDLSRFVRTLYEKSSDREQHRLMTVARDALQDAGRGTDALALVRIVTDSPRAWDEFSTRHGEMAQWAGYRSLEIGKIGREILHFFEEESGDPVADSTARRMRIYGAELFEKGDLEQLLRLMAQNPDNFYQILETLSTSERKGELQEFLDFAYRSLSARP